MHGWRSPTAKTPARQLIPARCTKVINSVMLRFRLRGDFILCLLPLREGRLYFRSRVGRRERWMKAREAMMCVRMSAGQRGEKVRVDECDSVITPEGCFYPPRPREQQRRTCVKTSVFQGKFLGAPCSPDTKRLFNCWFDTLHPPHPLKPSYFCLNPHDSRHLLKGRAFSFLTPCFVS